MSEPRAAKGGGASVPRKKRLVEALRNADFKRIGGSLYAYRGVPNGQRTLVRRNRTERETLDQMIRMNELYGDNSRAARAYARTVNAMIFRGRWGKL